MFLTVHATVGAIIGENIQISWLSFIIGILFHYFFDLIPHGDEKLNKLMPFKSLTARVFFFFVVDFLSILLLFSYLFTYTDFINLSPQVFWAIVGSVLPDFLWGFHQLTKIKLLQQYRKIDLKIHAILQNPIGIKQGMVVQYLLELLLIAIVINY